MLGARLSARWLEALVSSIRSACPPSPADACPPLALVAAAVGVLRATERVLQQQQQQQQRADTASAAGES